jgi:hypothetical protein
VAKLSNTAFAKRSRSCYRKHKGKRSRSAYWRCMNKGKKWRGRGSCEHGRITRGPRKGRCRKQPAPWARKARRRAARED